MLGLCISELRRSAEVLLIDSSGIHGKNNQNHMRPAHRYSGKVPLMDAFELTAFKLWFSSLTVFPFAYYFEGKAMIDSRVGLDGNIVIENRPGVTYALSQQRYILLVVFLLLLTLSSVVRR